MKFKVNFNKRHNIYITLFACFVGLWLMVNRFGLSLSTLLSYTIISVGLLLTVIALAAVAAWILRLISRKKK